MRRFRISAVVLALAVAGSVKLAQADIYDHIVVVIEENTSFSQVIGNSVDAPYINTLATGGVSFSQMYAVTHPSEPNYLQLFSGSDQGIKDDSTAGTVFTAANLGAALIASGRTFTGYSESMPSAGFTGSSFTTIAGQNQYMRKHNPWVNWQAANPTGNQLAASTNQPFTAFPTSAAGFGALPNVSIVVPNEQNDMHDGTIRMADDWLNANLSAYAAWAKNNNSLLVVTFDEDNSGSNDRIPTVMYGAGLNNRTAINTTYTLHNLLQTISSWNGVGGAAAPGLGAKTRAIAGAIPSLGTPTIKTFQQNVGGYSGTLTDNIKAITPNTASPGLSTMLVDSGTGTAPAQVLIKFSNLFSESQVPPNATILSAKLIFATDSTASSPNSVDTFRLYRMIRSWDGTSTWNSLGGGISADDAEASSASDFDVLPYASANKLGIFDVTDTVQAWANGATNNGWLLADATGTDGWHIFGETGTTAPRLEITYADVPLAQSVPEPATGLLLAAGAGILLLRPRRVAR